MDCFGEHEGDPVPAPSSRNVPARIATSLTGEMVGDAGAHGVASGEMTLALTENWKTVSAPIVVFELETRVTPVSQGTRSRRRIIRATDGCE